MQLYDRRDGIPFYIAFMPHLDSNIPSNIYYTSIGSKISRFAKTTSDINTFTKLSSCLLKKMQKQTKKYA